jgi:predicted DNA-binding transcriptional regulator AlpA
MRHYLRAKQAAAYFGIAQSTLWAWVKNRPNFPQPVKAAGRVTLFEVQEIDKHLRNQAAASQVKPKRSH